MLSKLARFRTLLRVEAAIANHRLLLNGANRQSG
jgi:hypothetical protein